MRPVELELVNIGPFTGTTVINFDSLGEMFLVTGKTGSGKTTIFDAITYALYGKLSGARSNLTVRSLRSDFCAPEAECRVRFDFTTGDDSWRVERCPPVPYTNRNGKLDEKPDTLVLYHNGEKVPGTKSELTEKLQGLLKLTVDEFSRIVLLPQGEFAQFLRDNSTKRQETLMKLFPVSLYSEIQKQAKEKADALKAAIDQLSAQIIDLEKELSELSVSSLQDAECQLESARKAQESLQQAVTEKDKALVILQGLLERVQSAEQALAKEERLRDEAEAHLERCQKELALRMAEKETLPAKSAELKLTEQAAFRIDTLMPKADTYWDTKNRYKAKNTELTAGKRALEELQSEESTLLQVIETTSQAKDRLLELTDRRANLAAEKSKLQESIALCSNLEEALRALQKARKELSEAEYTYNIKDAVFKDYERIKEDERIHWVLGELSASLEEGKPCPVCGAVHHPSPATISGTITTDEKLQAARKEAEAAQKTHQTAVLAENTAKTAAQAALDNVWQTTELAADVSLENGDTTLPAVKKQLETELNQLLETERTLQTERTEAESQAKTWEKSQKDLTETRAQLNTAKDSVNRLEQELTVLTSDGKAANADLTQFINSARSDFPGIDCLESLTLTPLPTRVQLQSLKRQLQTITQNLQQHIDSVETACQNARMAASNAQTALNGFGTSIAQRKQELDAARKQLSDVVTGDVTGYQENLKTELDSVEEQLKNANGTVLETGKILDNYRRIESKLESLRSDRTQKEAEASPCQRLNTAINGNNDKRMKLDSWILGMYLDQITRYASTRLLSMSEGRFTMHLKDTPSDGLKGRGLKGLDIEIDDFYTGKVRDPASLSGGETFMASLALALALTDVVQEGRGGIQLESLFIDEGFGSLDGDALESALGILDSIRGTRCVGIISHVSELYTRIPTHLEVEKTTAGSSAAVKILD